jgi:flagellar hook-basal body complex protein FliE
MSPKYLFPLLLSSLAFACHDESPPPKSSDQAQPEEGSTLQDKHDQFKKNLHETADQVEKDVNKAHEKVQKTVKETGKDLGVSSDVLGPQPDGGN